MRGRRAILRSASSNELKEENRSSRRGVWPVSIYGEENVRDGKRRKCISLSFGMMLSCEGNTLLRAGGIKRTIWERRS